MRRDPSAPSVPHRNGVTVRVKGDGDDSGGGGGGVGAGGVGASAAEGGSKAKHTPSGSHRVLLKLRRMSGGSSGHRPKSVPDASELVDASVAPNSSGGGAFAAEIRMPMSSDINSSSYANGSNSSRMKNSKSMHQMFYYNKTWNERSLSKCMREQQEHNYENIYSCDKDNDEENCGLLGGLGDYNPVYENVRFQQQSNNPFVSLIGTSGAGGGGADDQSMVIGQLSRSPRSSARTKRKPLFMGGGGSSSSNANDPFAKNLYRSKSCERPKMRDAVKETLRIQENLKHNISRISTNLQSKFSGGGHHSSAMTSSTSMFLNNNQQQNNSGGFFGGDNNQQQSGGFKAFSAGIDDHQPQVRKRG